MTLHALTKSFAVMIVCGECLWLHQAEVYCRDYKKYFTISLEEIQCFHCVIFITHTRAHSHTGPIGMHLLCRGTGVMGLQPPSKGLRGSGGRQLPVHTLYSTLKLFPAIALVFRTESLEYKLGVSCFVVAWDSFAPFDLANNNWTSTSIYIERVWEKKAKISENLETANMPSNSMISHTKSGNF